ncbi:geranylgeranyl pyrophosphate synthetase, partial [Rhizoctonia solani]
MENVLFLGLSGVVASIRPPSNGTGNSPVEVSNLKALGSYNWVKDQVPTIAIPGRPPVWKEQPSPIELSGDIGKPFFDEDIARKCGYPLEPDLLAIKVSQETDPSFKLSEENIDIVTNRNNLRKLIEFANSGTGNRGQTMVLTRYEARKSERQSNNRFIGFDYMFERIVTEELPSIRATNSGGRTVHLRPVGYHQIVRYDILGMRFLVRSRVDVMLQGPSNSVLGQIKLKLDSVDTSLPILHEEAAGMRYVNFGEFVPQDSLMDIKLAHKHHINWNNVYSQYFLSQTPNLKIADRTTVGRKCFVAQVDTYGKDSLKTEHEKRSQQFRNLVAVLREMRRTLQARGGSSQPLAFVYCQKGNLKAYIIREKGEYLSDEGLETF